MGSARKRKTDHKHASDEGVKLSHFRFSIRIALDVLYRRYFDREVSVQEEIYEATRSMRFETALGIKNTSRVLNGLIPEWDRYFETRTIRAQSVYYKALFVSRFKMNDFRSLFLRDGPKSYYDAIDFDFVEFSLETGKA